MRYSVGLAVLAFGVAGAAHAETWDMPMAYPDSNFHSENGKAFAACVGKGTGGDLEITVHAGGSLYKGDEIKRAIQTGQVPIGERLLSAHQNENPVFGFDSVPFLATSYDASATLYEEAKPTLEKILANQNLVLLYSVPWPPQGLYTKKDVESAADMKGVKFRSYNTTTARLAELMGAVPVQIEAAELSQALATGVAESFISSGSTGYDSKVWEQLDHFYDIQAWLPRNYVMANKGAWEGLDEKTRNAVLACADEAAKRGTARSQELNDYYKEELAKNGMTVAAPSDQLTADLLKFGQTLTEEWLRSAGTDGQAIVDAYQAKTGG
ncbi:MAG: TRAP transporter substrate-binding protein [Geminicoccaceae bacterium]|nr:TRAP transporter substrate-binding protein [Geminicoccaceae bacterium]